MVTGPPSINPIQRANPYVVMESARRKRLIKLTVGIRWRLPGRAVRWNLVRIVGHLRLRRVRRPAIGNLKPDKLKPQRLHSRLDRAFPVHERQRACVRPVNHVQVTGGQDAVL